MMEFNLKKEALKVGAGILYVLAIYWVMIYFSLNIYQVYGLLLCSSALLMLVTKTFKFKQLIINAITLALIFVLMVYLGKVGGFFISTIAICGIILYTRRKRYLEVKRHIEAMIWGKPLKDFFDNGKKPPKLKLSIK